VKNIKWKDIVKINNRRLKKMTTRGNAGRGSRGACGKTRRRDGSGRGVGNISKRKSKRK